MGVHITGQLDGPVTTRLTHESGSSIATMAPKDNGGDGSTFSPTDLLAASLGSCGATTMALFATRSGIPLESVSFSVEKIMTAEAPRRVGKLVVRYEIFTPASPEEFQKLVNAAKTCPVRRSLAPEVAIEESFARG